ncbi:MAG: putative gluconeogenesis factor [Herpetosiphonaceae bacterium]|nr:MAG: putative gluconeogenesis factor [Herpetosiphonaceae bacterium]
MRWRERPGLKWLYPGMHVKRWLVLLLGGVTSLALGLALLLRHFYLSGLRLPPVFYYVTLQFVPRPARAMVLGSLGLALIVIAILKLNDSLLSTLLPARQRRPNLADLVYRRRQSQRGPRVVAIGGGHGLSTLLSGLKLYTDHITAIVNVADDGGSSGRIRRDFGILPPGDIRRCLAALSEAEPLMAALMEYRFANGEGLEGHTFGNLLITALADLTGSFEEAISEASRVLAVRGEIVPPTLSNVTLCAELHGENGEAGRHIAGESQITSGGMPIKRVYLDPPDAPAYSEAVRAILSADLVVIGPGSLYTSILPVLLVNDITRAIRTSQAVRIYVCNVATEPGETDHFGVQAHIQALIDHLGPGVFDVALANSNQEPAENFAPEWRGRTAIVPLDADEISGVRLVTADIINPSNPLRHDPARLASELMRILGTYPVNMREQAAALMPAS